MIGSLALAGIFPFAGLLVEGRDPRERGCTSGYEVFIDHRVRSARSSPPPT